MSENLKTWGKCANLFFNLRQLFFAKRKQYRYNFCVLRFAFLAKSESYAYRTDLRYNVINEPFSLVYR